MNTALAPQPREWPSLPRPHLALVGQEAPSIDPGISDVFGRIPGPPVVQHQRLLLRPPEGTRGFARAISAEEALPRIRAWCLREGHDRVAAIIRRAQVGQSLRPSPPDAALWLALVDSDGCNTVERQPSLFQALEVALTLDGPPEILRTLFRALEELETDRYP